MKIDPRVFLAMKRFSTFKHIIPVVSPKGGVGKTTIATLLSITLSDKFDCVSLLDLDINNPTAHIVLGIDLNTAKIEEDKGILPLKLYNSKLEFMSIALFTQNKLLPLRGREISNIVLELLSITKWSGKILVVDTPPGFSDEIMDLIRIASNKIKPIVISTPDKLSLISAKRIIEILEKENIYSFVIGNMCSSENELKAMKNYLALHENIITCIPRFNEVNEMYGFIEKLRILFEPYLAKIIDLIIE